MGMDMSPEVTRVLFGLAGIGSLDGPKQVRIRPERGLTATYCQWKSRLPYRVAAIETIIRVRLAKYLRSS